ncbi:hypothetical protein D3C78_1719960 [compost metagenome]
MYRLSLALFGVHFLLRQFSVAMDLPGVLFRSCKERPISKSKSFCSFGVRLNTAVPLRMRCSLKPLRIWSSARRDSRPLTRRPSRPSISGPEA